MRAAADAADLRSRWPALGSVSPVRAASVARKLGVQLCTRPALGHRAILSHRIGGGNTSQIFVDDSVGSDVRRWCIAHELGHLMLLTKREEWRHLLSFSEAERFADMFAAELLLPPLSRHEAQGELWTVSRAYDLLHLSRSYGLSPSAFLRTIYRVHSGEASRTRAWLRVEHRANKYTGLTQRLRIVSSLYSREHMFIPTNQSVTSLLGEDAWLGGLRPGECQEQELEARLSIKTRNDRGPVFVKRSVRTKASAVRVDSPASSAYFLLLRFEGDAPTSSNAPARMSAEARAEHLPPHQSEIRFD